jgi:hypothetical protein
MLSPGAHMAYTAILQRIRLLIPAELDGHYKAVCRGFEERDLTSPRLSPQSIGDRLKGFSTPVLIPSDGVLSFS